ncbi:hypothetical protein Tco_0154755 [Tanacetum coccineum]
MPILHSFEENKLEYEDEDEVEINMMGIRMDKESLEHNLYEDNMTPIICHNFSPTSNPPIKPKDSGNFRMKACMSIPSLRPCMHCLVTFSGMSGVSKISMSVPGISGGILEKYTLTGLIEEETGQYLQTYTTCSRISLQWLETASQIQRDAVTTKIKTASKIWRGRHNIADLKKLLASKILSRTRSSFIRNVRSKDVQKRGTMFLNMDQIEKQLDKEEFQEIGSIAAFKVLETQF